jgi:hypothetical protein
VRGWQRWLVVSSVSAALVTGGAVGQAPAAESTLDSGSVAGAVEALTGLAEREVRASGGDLGSQHVHWVFAFSTGHFALDPIRAQAARETVLALLERSAVPGDLVSVVAFEMDVWRHAGAEANPLTLPDDAAVARRSVAAMLPLTTQAGSRGGHDTERALVDIAAGVEEAAGPIIFVFTNRAASLTTDAAARPLLGEDAVAYQSLLRAWRRAPAVNRSGAAFEATYEVERATGERVVTTLDVVLLTPAAFVSAPTPAPRSELALGNRRPRPVSPSADGDTEGPIGRAAAIAAALAIAGLGALAMAALRRRATSPGRGGQRIVTIQGAPIPLDGLRAGAVVCRVVARGFREDDESADRSPTIVHDQVPFGDEPLGRIVWQRGGLAWKDASFRATRWRGRPTRSPVRLGTRGGSLALEGTVRERPGMPPRSLLASLEIEMGGSA